MFFTRWTRSRAWHLCGTRVSSDPFRSLKKVARTRKKFNSIEHAFMLTADTRVMIKWCERTHHNGNNLHPFIVTSATIQCNISIRRSDWVALSAFQCIESIVSHTILRWLCLCDDSRIRKCLWLQWKKTGIFFVFTAAEVQLHLAHRRTEMHFHFRIVHNTNGMKQKKRIRANRWRRFRWR